jgi:hypothetical protein
VNEMKLHPKQPLFYGNTVRESRRAEAEYYKDIPADCGAKPVCPGMSERRMKKAWAKHESGSTLSGRCERKLVRYYLIQDAQKWDEDTLANAY